MRTLTPSGVLVDVALVALLLFHGCQVLGCMVEGAVGAAGDDVKEGGLYILGHAGSVAADVEVGSALEPLVELFAVLLHAVLNVDLARLVAGEGGVEAGENAILVHGLELVFVEEVHGFALFAEEEPVVAFLAGGLAL